MQCERDGGRRTLMRDAAASRAAAPASSAPVVFLLRRETGGRNGRRLQKCGAESVEKAPPAFHEASLRSRAVRTAVHPSAGRRRAAAPARAVAVAFLLQASLPV